MRRAPAPPSGAGPLATAHAGLVWGLPGSPRPDRSPNAKSTSSDEAAAPHQPQPGGYRGTQARGLAVADRLRSGVCLPQRHENKRPSTDGRAQTPAPAPPRRTRRPSILAASSQRRTVPHAWSRRIGAWRVTPRQNSTPLAIPAAKLPPGSAQAARLSSAASASTLAGGGADSLGKPHCSTRRLAQRRGSRSPVRPARPAKPGSRPACAARTGRPAFQGRTPRWPAPAESAAAPADREQARSRRPPELARPPRARRRCPSSRPTDMRAPTTSTKRGYLMGPPV